MKMPSPSSPPTMLKPNPLLPLDSTTERGVLAGRKQDTQKTEQHVHTTTVKSCLLPLRLLLSIRHKISRGSAESHETLPGHGEGLKPIKTRTHTGGRGPVMQEGRERKTGQKEWGGKGRDRCDRYGDCALTAGATEIPHPYVFSPLCATAT